MTCMKECFEGFKTLLFYMAVCRYEVVSPSRHVAFWFVATDGKSHVSKMCFMTFDHQNLMSSSLSLSNHLGQIYKNCLKLFVRNRIYDNGIITVINVLHLKYRIKAGQWTLMTRDLRGRILGRPPFISSIDKNRWRLEHFYLDWREITDALENIWQCDSQGNKYPITELQILSLVPLRVDGS